MGVCHSVSSLFCLLLHFVPNTPLHHFFAEYKVAYQSGHFKSHYGKRNFDNKWERKIGAAAAETAQKGLQFELVTVGRFTENATALRRGILALFRSKWIFLTIFIIFRQSSTVKNAWPFYLCRPTPTGRHSWRSSTWTFRAPPIARCL